MPSPLLEAQKPGSTHQSQVVGKFVADKTWFVICCVGRMSSPTTFHLFVSTAASKET
jgi:hypothetical protein